MAETRKLCIRFDWRVSALVLLLLPVTVSLGFWQLSRAEEKRQLQQVFEQRRSAGPVPLETLPVGVDWSYQPVTLKGSFLSGQTVLLDNRIHNGRFGYEVVTPFRLSSSDMIVLVNRGWVTGDISRRTLPEVSQPGGELLLKGDIYVPQGKLLSLAPGEAQGWPRVMQTLEVEQLAPTFAAPLFPYSIRLDAASPGAFEPNWMVVNIQPSKHTGYAVQWFGMAVALVLIAVFGNSNLWSWITQKRGE